MRFARLIEASCSDWPGEVAAVLFTVGCNMRCTYCSNYDLFAESEDDFGEDEALQMLRKSPLNHLVLCGGEPTIQANLDNFCRNLKEVGWHIRLDTNGLLPNIIADCMPYLDAICVDIKTTPEHYESLTGKELPWRELWSVLGKHPEIVSYRTTLVSLNEITPDVVLKIRSMIPDNADHCLHTRIIERGYGGRMFPWTEEALASIQ